MCPGDVRQIIEDEIGGDWGLSNLHGVELQRSLMKVPEKRSYRNSWFKTELPVATDNRRMIDLWLVLEEDAAGHGDYEIVFGEDRRQFGLAHRGTFINYYGSFRDTLAAM